jgi:hypothetical protein
MVDRTGVGEVVMAGIEEGAIPWETPRIFVVARSQNAQNSAEGAFTDGTETGHGGIGFGS